jgi:hypothetical protein
VGKIKIHTRHVWRKIQQMAWVASSLFASSLSI